MSDDNDEHGDGKSGGKSGGKPARAVAPKIMVIRHAEKPADNPPPHGVDTDGDHDEESLSVRGWQRAGALAVLLAPATGPLQNSALATPHFAFSSKLDKDNGSDRPQQTIKPLLDRLDREVMVNFEHGIGDESDLAAAAMACGGTVLISWAHSEITAIVKCLPVSKKTAVLVPEEWPDERFDLVWVFDLDPASNEYQFSQVPQLVLSGDKRV
jgi:hypothetical protein